MKSLAITFSVLVFITTSLFSQNQDVYSTIKVDSGYINVDGGKLFYEEAGVGENIVLIHDGSVHHVIWDGQFMAFAKNNHVVRYDRRSYGKSSIPEAPFSNIEDLNQLFNQLKIEKATVFGMSAGGGLAIDFTLKYPEKVSSLVLVGAVVGGFPYTQHMMSRGGHFDFRNPKYADVKNIIQYFGWEDPYEVYPENTKAKERLLSILQANPQNMEEKGANFQKQPDRIALKYLAEIKVPTLILVGEFDIPDVQFHAGAIASGISTARIEVISKAGHLIPLEQPDAFNNSVLKFMKNQEFLSILNTKGVHEAVNFYNKYKAINPNLQFLNENLVNNLGYNLLNQNKVKEAIELFILNTIAFPNSPNVFDSLGEAYMKDNQNDLAIKNYEKALELNPNNTNAQGFLNNLKREKKSLLGKKMLNNPESIIYDKAHNRYLLSNYNTGSIVQIDRNGKQSVLVDTMNAIQGLVIAKNVVYVGARTSIRGFDLETGKMVLDVKVDNVSNLNDVTTDDAGNIYAGDVFGTKIIKVNLKTKKYSVFVDGKGIDHPNGITFDKSNNRILVCSFRANTPIQSISLVDSTVTTLTSTNLSNSDGIALDKYGRCYFTSWATNSIYRFDKGFSNQPTLFYTNPCGPADIQYDEVHDAIIVPLMNCNSYEIVPVDKPLKKSSQ